MTSPTPDVIDQLAGIAPGSPLDAIRAARRQTRDNAQASYLALFETAETAEMSRPERFAVACFVAGLHGQEAERAFYAARLEALAPGLADTVAAEAARGRAPGPAGHYPPGPLSAEDTEGATYAAGARDALGVRLAAALEHAHLLVVRPRDASAAALQALLDAGWSTTGIVTLSQLVAFLAFQLRVIHGLRALSRSLAARDGSIA